MSITRRVPFLAALGAAATLGAYPVGWHFHVFLFANLLIAGLVVLDVIITPRGKVFSAQYAGDPRGHLYFKSENVLRFTIRNHSGTALKIQALGDMGDAGRFFQAAAKKGLTLDLFTREEREYSYTVIPAKRGQFTVDGLFLRYRGVLGLCVKHTYLPCRVELKVYPNVRDLSKFRLMMRNTRLLPPGEKAIKHFGAGTEFESLRAYVKGDDYRKINWSATAREGRLIVNQFRIERNQPVYILLDCARPMSYSVGGYKKLDYAINAALVLADIVNQQGDQAGLLTFGADIGAHVKPGKGPHHRNLLMETLYQIEGNRLTADYERAFQVLCEKQKRRSLVFIFTDFEILEEAEELIKNIALLKRRHMPFVVFMENEGLKAMAESDGDRTLRETAQEFLTERAKIIRQLNAMQIPAIESGAENFAAAAVNRYIRSRG